MSAVSAASSPPRCFPGAPAEEGGIDRAGERTRRRIIRLISDRSHRQNRCRPKENTNKDRDDEYRFHLVIWARTPLILPTLLILVIMETAFFFDWLLSAESSAGGWNRGCPGEKLGSSAAHGDVQWQNQCRPITNYQNNGGLRGEAELWQLIYPVTTSARRLLVNA